MSSRAPHIHLGEAALVRLVDGELIGEERSSAESAVAACDVCRSSAQRVRHRSSRLTGTLPSGDWAPPADALGRIRGAHAAATGGIPAMSTSAPMQRPVREPTRWRIAAGIALLLIGGALLTTPAAAWLARAAERAWSTITGEATTSPGPAAPTDPSLAERSWGHVPAAGELVLRLGGRVHGELRVEAWAGPTLELRITGAAAPEVLLLPAEVRVDGAAAGAAIRLLVPPSITAVRVQHGDAAPVLLDATRLGGGASVPLAERR